MSRSSLTTPLPSRGLLLSVAALLTAGLIALGVVMLDGPDHAQPPIASDGSSSLLNPQPTMRAPGSATRSVHRALHAVGGICQPDASVDRTIQVRPYVQTILDFARRYPSVRFSIDGETGTTVSLLVLVRYNLRTCSPSLARRANQALPPAYRLPDGTG